MGSLLILAFGFSGTEFLLGFGLAQRSRLSLKLLRSVTLSYRENNEIFPFIDEVVGNRETTRRTYRSMRVRINNPWKSCNFKLTYTLPPRPVCTMFDLRLEITSYF
ncbi:hypothetical protein BpHYR1_010704 [Brachionus plicatilis]|uniref:Uncharacterized protein n=1 Tax=Brachionus plicatilis TaxID=10195 RepID=A0A3M7SKN2_BRAPC|nr:hypothetical protein BpHYR1_010704 [Brachionus plicatilis]